MYFKPHYFIKQPATTRLRSNFSIINLYYCALYIHRVSILPNENRIFISKHPHGGRKARIQRVNTFIQFMLIIYSIPLGVGGGSNVRTVLIALS